MSAPSHIRLDVQALIATLTLDRSPVNALDAALVRDLNAAFDALVRDHAASVLVVRSSQKVFCAGADLAVLERFMRSEDPGARLHAYAADLQALVRRFEALPCVTVCQMAGAAMGGGLEFALAADFRIASDRAKLGLPEIGLGLIPAAGGTQRLARLCGLQAARQMILRGRTLSAAEARDLGLVDEVFPHAEFEQRAAEIASRLARQPAAALRAAKTCLGHYATAADGGFDAEKSEIGSLIGLPETQRRIRDFVEKSTKAA